MLADGEAVPAKARLRMVHAAPELGEPDVSLDGRTISSRTPYTTVTSYGSSVAPELVLITCGGAFDEGEDTYRDSIVVYARAL